MMVLRKRNVNLIKDSSLVPFQMNVYGKIMIKISESKSDSSIISTLYRTITKNRRRLSTSGNVLHRQDLIFLFILLFVSRHKNKEQQTIIK